MLSLVTACVSVNNKIQPVSNAFAATSNLPLCESSAFIMDETNTDQGLNPENISFLSWNMYKGNGEGWQKDLSFFAQSHDLMTIQEVVLEIELSGLLATYGFNWNMNTSFYLNGTAAGVMTVARPNAVQSCGFNVIEPLIQVPKSTLVSYYAIEGSKDRLLVANIHAINFAIGVSAYRQQLEQLYHAIKYHEGPMIVAGDFNSWSDDRMGLVSELINKLSLSRIEYQINNKTHVFGNAIDHVFYRQLELVSNKVWQVSSSDHNPISVNFRFVQSSVF